MSTGFSLTFLSAIVCLQWGKVMAGCFDFHIGDICNTKIEAVPYMSSRDPATTVTNETLQRKYCDLFAMEKQQWYRSEVSMTTTCPEMYKCGAKFPIWMNGSQPEEDEGIVNRVACVRGYENCCLIRYRLATVNCGQYYAYCLLDLPSGCPQRYCFDRHTGLSSSGTREWTSASWRNASIPSTITLSSEPETEVPVKNVKGVVLDNALIIILTVILVFIAVSAFTVLMLRRQLKIEVKNISPAKEAQNNKFLSQNVSVLGNEKADYGLYGIYKVRYTGFDVDTGDLGEVNKTGYIAN